MSKVRRAVEVIRRAEVPLYVLTTVLALYLAAANALRGAKVPDEEFWAPWGVPFLAMLACGLYVPLYALYKALDARFERTEKEEAEAARARSTLERDLEIACQKVVSEIAARCPGVEINHLATHVWLCRQDGSFERLARFLLPHERKRSGTVWCRGKGVAGMAWEGNADLRSDLRPICRRLDRLGDARFNALDPSERLGLTAQDARNTRDYAGICAIRLFADDGTILGVFVIDYTGEQHFACVAATTTERRTKALIGGCEDLLSEAADTL